MDRAHKLGIRLTDISGGQGDLADRLALSQFGEERLKSQIREAEKVLRERRQETIKLVLTAVGVLTGIVALITKVLGW